MNLFRRLEGSHGDKGDEFQYSDLIAERFGIPTTHRIFVPSSKVRSRCRDVRGECRKAMVSYEQVGSTSCSKEGSPSTSRWSSRGGAPMRVFGGYQLVSPARQFRTMWSTIMPASSSDRLRRPRMAERRTRNG